MLLKQILINKMCLWNTDVPDGNQVKIWLNLLDLYFDPARPLGEYDVSEVWETLRWTYSPNLVTVSPPKLSHSQALIFSSTGRDQSSLCDTLLSVCPSVRLSVRKQFLLSHLLWGYLSQRLLYSPSLLALWCSSAPAIVIMILSPGAQNGGRGHFPYISLCKSCYRISS